jgi:hypothetical protein
MASKAEIVGGDKPDIEGGRSAAARICDPLEREVVLQGFCGHTRGKVPRKFNEPCGAMREQEAPASLEFYEGYILGFHRIVSLCSNKLWPLVSNSKTYSSKGSSLTVI